METPSAPAAPPPPTAPWRGYARYCLAMVAGFGLALAAWIGAIQLQFGAPTAKGRWTAEVTAIKARIAATTPSPKLLVVCGSNGLFGIRSELIERETGWPSVNMSNHAALGIHYLLWQARAAAKSGDVIVMPLEYELYQETGATTEILMEQVLQGTPDYLRTMGPAPYLRFILSVKQERVLEGLQAKLRPPVLPTGGYQARTLNAHGDETNNRHEKAHLSAEETRWTSTIDGISPESIIWGELRRFREWCRDHNIRLLASYPATIYFPVYEEARWGRTVRQIEEFYRSLDVPVLGTPRDFMYDRSFFYDTAYHLTDRGMEQRTRRLIELLRPHLGEHPHLARRGGQASGAQSSAR